MGFPNPGPSVISPYPPTPVSSIISVCLQQANIPHHFLKNENSMSSPAFQIIELSPPSLLHNTSSKHSFHKKFPSSVSIHSSSHCNLISSSLLALHSIIPTEKINGLFSTFILFDLSVSFFDHTFFSLGFQDVFLTLALS